MSQRARPMSVAEKRIIGVQVLPDPFAALGGHSHGLGSTPLSASSALERNNNLAGGGAALMANDEKLSPLSHDSNSSSSSLKWKLRHQDFMPNTVKSKKEDDYERFSTLIERANQWSIQNPQCLVFSFETVTWMGIDRPIFTDSGIMQKSMHSDRKSKVMRGLRVWYFVYDDTFFDQSSCPGPFKLGYINYTLEGKTDAFPSLLSKINGDMFKRNVAGKIVKLETLHMMGDVADPDVCFWFEQPDKARDFVSFVRLLYIFKKDGMEDQKYGDIGFRDFIPVCDQRTPHNQGYEVFADLWRKAARWIHSSPNLKFINAQGLFVKVKKDTDSQSTLWDRCNHKEHGSAYGSLSHQKTEYFQVLRVVYHQPAAPAGSGGGAAGGAEQLPKKLYYKVFTPLQLKRAVNIPTEDQDPLPMEGLFEDLRQLEEKTNAWLSYSGAKVCGIETVPTRLTTGGQEMLGPEATFVYNDREKNQGRESHRVNIRIYLDGDFKEVPAMWRSSIHEQAFPLTSGATNVD